MKGASLTAAGQLRIRTGFPNACGLFSRRIASAALVAKILPLLSRARGKLPGSPGAPAFGRRAEKIPPGSPFREEAGPSGRGAQTASYLSRVIVSRLIPSMRMRRVSPSRWGEWNSPTP